MHADDRPIRDPRCASYLAISTISGWTDLTTATCSLLAVGRDLKFTGSLARERDKQLGYFGINVQRMATHTPAL